MQREGLKTKARILFLLLILSAFKTHLKSPSTSPQHQQYHWYQATTTQTWPTCPTFLAHTFLDPCWNSSPVNQTTFCQYRVSLFLRPVHDYRILFECLSCHCYQSKRNNAGKNSMFSITILETVSGCLELNFPNFLGLLCIFSVSSTKHMQGNIESWCST